MNGSGKEISIKPIGTFFSSAEQPYQAPRQPDEQDRPGTIEIETAFVPGLKDLEGFDRIWLIFQFHHNENWKPLVLPPRGSSQKVGVFASRSPYRPNPLGISCVRLLEIHKNKLFILGADLLNETPIFDIKPYLVESDCFPNSRQGWLEGAENTKFQIHLSELSQKQFQWLAAHGENQILDFTQRQLEYFPTDSKRKRVKKIHDVANDQTYELSYRTWRIEFEMPRHPSQNIFVSQLYSGYSEMELASAEDPYLDKDQHRQFMATFSGL